MATYTKQLLSGSTNGKNIAVTTTSGTYTTIHAALSGSTGYDEVWLYAFNSYGSTISLNFYWGGTTASDVFSVGVPANGSGRVLVADGRLLNSSLVVTANTSSSGTNGLFVDGFINRIQ